jgi:hypothetical protein
LSSLHAVGVVLLVFAVVKLAIAGRALRERRAFREGRSTRDPEASFAKPWLFNAWVGWRLAAAALSLVAGVWLLLH